MYLPGKTPSAPSDSIDLETQISNLPINLSEDTTLGVDHMDVVGLNPFDLQSFWSTLIKQEASRMTDLSLSLKDLLENLSNHVGRHMKTLLCHAPGIFHLSLYLLSTPSRLTQDIPREKTRQPLLLEAHEEIQRLQKWTIELLGVVPIPIQHVVIVRTHGPIVHRHPLHHTIRSKD